MSAAVPPDRPAESAAADRFGVGAAGVADDLPAGTVTFLFTDIEGSTRLWEAHPAAMPVALARHDALLRAAVAAHGGRVFKTIGDALCAVFPEAPAAVVAAVAAQRALRADGWGETGPLRVRMALHTGPAAPDAADYLGPTVNKVARLLAAGHGGQILVSSSTAARSRDALPSGVGLDDLGPRRLRDVTEPERVFQVVAPDLRVDFPPLNALDAAVTGLPVPLTPLVGREAEVAAAVSLLRQREVRLVSLTGPGGVGKTRLAVQVAAEIGARFADGVRFVDLAPIVDPALVPATIALALGLREGGDRSPAAAVTEYLRDRQVLLLLDNVEQVTAAAPALAQLLAACPGLTLLVTSRASLHISPEHELPVAPLGLPDPKRPPTVEALDASPAVRLFLARARAVRPDLLVTAATVADIAAICARLDGLPLALEMAAAWARVLAPSALLARLERRLPLLTGGPRDLPARQQTMRSAIAWSFGLLPPEEQVLFRRLAVFVGGFALDAAEAVCGAVGGDCAEVLEGISSLIDKSLLRPAEGPAGEPRFRMLETVREFGLETLAASGEAEAIHHAHSAHFLELAERGDEGLTGPDQAVWAARLDIEHDNLRAGLRWLLDRGDAELALRLATALWRFWTRGYPNEGQTWLLRAVTAAGDASPALRAKALHYLGNLALDAGEYVPARTRYEASLALKRELGDEVGVASSLNGLGIVAFDRGDLAQARALHEESLAIRRRLGDAEEMALTLYNLGRIDTAEGNHGRARELLAEALAAHRRSGDLDGIAYVNWALGRVALDEGDEASAHRLFEDSQSVFEAVGDKFGVAYVRNDLARLAFLGNDLRGAAALYEQSLDLRLELGERQGIAECLNGLGRVARGLGQPERAARLWGMAAGLREAIGTALPPSDQALLDRDTAATRLALGPAAFAAAWETGRAMTVEQALGEAAALAVPADAAGEGTAEAASAAGGGLTSRERDVLRLIVEGQSSREIADALFVSHRTVSTHITSIFNKLGVSSRSAAAAHAVRHRLV